MSTFKNKLVILMGPTACGKTDLALALAKEISIEIVSVDSALIYRDMNVGTAKPTPEELASVPHHLIDIINPDQNYSVAEFLRDAKQAIESIWQRGKLPCLLGGTMMYFKAWRDGLAEIPTVAPEIRLEIAERLISQGLTFLYQELQQCDPLIAARLSEHDSQRITRALEVFYGTGQPLSFWQQQQAMVMPRYHELWIKLEPETRATLHERIALRFKKMLEMGFVDEVKALRQKYQLDLHCASLRCVGYRQVWQYLQHEIRYDEMQERGIIATRQLAKRQLTWLRSWHNAKTLAAFDPHNLEQLTQMIQHFLSEPPCSKSPS